MLNLSEFRSKVLQRLNSKRDAILSNHNNRNRKYFVKHNGRCIKHIINNNMLRNLLKQSMLILLVVKNRVSFLSFSWPGTWSGFLSTMQRRTPTLKFGEIPLGQDHKRHS